MSAMTKEEWELRLRLGQEVEINVANWLLATTDSSADTLADTLPEFDVSAWKSKDGKAHLQQTKTWNGRGTFWHMQGKSDVCDLAFYLKDVPVTSALGSMLLGNEPGVKRWQAADQMLTAVKKQGYIKVEVKSTHHAHIDESRKLAKNSWVPCEFVSWGRPSGFRVSKAHLVVWAVRNYCDEADETEARRLLTPEQFAVWITLPNPGCGSIWPSCAQRKAKRLATHPNDPRNNYSYWPLPMASMQHLINEAESAKQFSDSFQNNKSKAARVPLAGLREVTMIRETAAKRYADLLVCPATAYKPR